MADEASVDGTSSSQAAGESSESTIEINIKTLDSQIYTFRVNKDIPVSLLKEKIVNATGVPVEQQRLIFRGKVLKDDHHLSAYHLEDGHTLHLVARQLVPAQHTPGTGSGDAQNSGNDSTGAPRNRIGQVSHSVVLGTVNMADPGEGMVADVGRLIGAVLNSFGVGNLASNGGASNTSSVTSNQASPSAETEGTQNTTGGTQPSNPSQAGFQFQFPQISQIPRLTTIPDSLTTLSEFISRMELALPQDGSSPPTNVREPPRSEVPSLNSRGLPTPEVLGAVIERVQQFLTGNAGAALSYIAARLERENASADPVVRSQIQAEAMRVGVVMQHLGAMFLELGRTIMTLRMGQSPAEALVNAGPAVYISPTGPNPIMVQPFPLQPSSLFGVPSPSLFSGLQVPLGAGDPSRNINIHIHAGSSVAPGVQSVGTRANLGEAIRGERPNVEQASINGNGAGNSIPMRGLPSRTVVAAIPARSSVIYPLQVRSQQAVPLHSASAQASHPTVSSATQPNRPVSVPQPSSEPDTTSTLVSQLTAHIGSVLAAYTQGQQAVPVNSASAQAPLQTVTSGTQRNTQIPAPQTSSESDSTSTLVSHLNDHMANVLAANTQGQSLSNPSMRSIDTQGIRPSVRSGAQPNTASQPPHATQINTQLLNTLSNISHGQSSSPSVRPREGPQLDPPGSSMADNEACEMSDSGELLVLDTGMTECDEHQLPRGGIPISNNPDSRESLFIAESSATKSVDGPAICQANNTFPSIPVIESSQRNLDSVATEHTSRSNQGGQSDMRAPLGLGLGGLQPKRRSKPSKPTGKNDVSHGTPSTNQNQQSIARGQQVLHSFLSQTSDRNRVDPNGSSIPLPLPSVISQIMDGMSLGSQDSGSQVDSGSMISDALQIPALNNLLTGVAEQAGFGRPDTLRNMLEQFTQNPAIMNTMNEVVQQVGQNEDIGSMLSGLGRGHGGIDFSRMIQQMMPVVSQALGRGSARPTPPTLVPGVQSQPPQCHDVIISENDTLVDRNSQINVQQVVERIEQHDSPGNVFRSLLESAVRLLGEGNSFGDLVEEFGDNMELTNEFMEMLKRRIRLRLQSESGARDET